MSAELSLSLSPTDVTVALIAGGKGTRMGQPKAWLRVRGQSILGWMLDRLQWPGPTMLVTAPAIPPPPDRERFDQHVADPVDGAGPLLGILTALNAAQTPALIALAVDMPWVDRHYANWLAQQLSDRPACLGVMGRAVVDGESNIQPLPAAFRIEAAAAVEGELEKGQRSLHRLCHDPRFVAVPVPPDWPAALWTNLNNQQQMRAFEAQIAEDLPINFNGAAL